MALSIHPKPAAAPHEVVLLTQQATDWVADNFFAVAIATGIGAAVVLILLGIKELGERLCRHDKTGMGWPGIFGRVISRTRIWFMIPLAAMLVDGYAKPPPLVAHTIHFLFTVVAALQSALWARELVLGLVEHRAGGRSDPGALGSAMGLIRVFVTFAMFSIATVLILDNLGVNVTGLVAGLGIGGIAIGLAAQGIFSDLFAALSIIFDRPFRVGDTIKFGSATGTVESIGMKTVRIRSVDGEEIIVSNAKLLGDQIRNMQYIVRRRVLLNLQLHYQNDPALLGKLPDELKAIVSAQRDCVFDHAWINDFGVNGVMLELLFHVDNSNAEVMNEMRHIVMTRTMQRFGELGIQFSFQAVVPEQG